VYVLCNPHNPVGRAHSPGELRALVELAARHGVTVVSDEIHGPLALPGATFTPLLTVPGAARVAVAVLSASKAWNLAGLKCAAVVTASPEMAAAVAGLPADSRWRVGHLGVLASVAALTDEGPWLDRLLLTLDRRRAQLGALLADRLPAVRWVPPEATYLAWLDCTALGEGDRPRELFLDRGRVGLEPGLRFGRQGSGFVRLNLGTSAEVLDEAVTRMAAAAGASQRGPGGRRGPRGSTLRRREGGPAGGRRRGRGVPEGVAEQVRVGPGVRPHPAGPAAVHRDGLPG
jgi:cystathionine beta-lyase